MRKITELGSDWIFVKKAEDAREAAEAEGVSVTLPHTWNAIDGQDGGNDYYRGTCWYRRSLHVPELAGGERAYLEFDGAAMTADIYLNGEKLAHHEGGYSRFRVELTEKLADGENLLLAAVDNSDNGRVYPQKADFTFYGGLYRMARLVIVPEKHFAMNYYGGDGIKVTPEVTLAAGDGKKAASARVAVEVWTEGGAEYADITVAEETKRAAVTDGCARAEFYLESVRLWDGPEDPYLYTARAELGGGDRIETRFGCRSFRIDPQEGFFLNGRPYPLRGVSRHQDRAGMGNALTPAMHREDMEIIKELGANTLRLAHYQHAQEFYDLCDENGIIVWAEIPYITMHMSGGRDNTVSQMKELVVQNYNHPSIVCWGLSNEITAASAVNEELLENHRELNRVCHELDQTRKTVMANVFMLETDRPILEIPDLNSYNLYFGWYVGEMSQTDEFFDEYHSKYPDRCIGFSEYGADANPAYHSSSPDRGDYTEEYQCLYHEHMLRMIEERPWLWATHVWNLFDFAADGRDEGGKHGENQKGLVTIDRRLKKDAFYLYKAWWSGEAFVHLCGRRYVDRAEEVTEVKVYSNQPTVALYVDGKLKEEQRGSRVFRFSVPLSGEHRIEARSGECRDEMIVRRTAEANPDYRFVKEGDIVNWFDKEDFRGDCYSVGDTLGELAKSPEANAIVQKLMGKASASRGDVAESVKDNPALQRMMQRMTLQSLLKQAGDVIKPEEIRALNEALQKIRKVNSAEKQ
ncbi:MAG: glycoside hydrolase family 2 protein [Roseburia sp.]|nr:glycoside hydrolase family 2 protein [Roseburia sp.]MCM1098732.1 glycoside hydrolase family 2 protein [Ruminococcus flavefaciens]